MLQQHVATAQYLATFFKGAFQAAGKQPMAAEPSDKIFNKKYREFIH